MAAQRQAFSSTDHAHKPGLPVEFARLPSTESSSCSRRQEPFSTTIDQSSPSTAKMADAQVTLRTRKFIRNPLLARKQMVV